MRASRTYSNSATFKIFAERDLGELLRQRSQDMIDYINGHDENYVLTVAEVEFVDHVTVQYMIEPPSLQFDDIYVDTYIKAVPGAPAPSLFPQANRPNPYTQVETQALVFHIPFTGNAEVLRCRPSTWQMRTWEMIIDGHDLCFELVDLQDDATNLGRQKDEISDTARMNAPTAIREVRQFNDGLRAQVESAFRVRKQLFLKRRNTVAALGVPLKRRNDLLRGLVGVQRSPLSAVM